MEKKIARISRWLERCLKACSAGSWSSALLDMECAKAELEEVRAELWSRAESRVQGAGARKTAMVLRVSCVTLALLLSLAAPLAIQTAAPVSRSAERHFGAMHSSEGALEWVTGDEKALLAALRKSLSEANREWIAGVADLSSEHSDKAERRGLQQGETTPRAPSEGRPASAGSRSGRAGGGGARTEGAKDSVAVRREGGQKETQGLASSRELDSIITLVQIGQKALRERESPIEFQ